MFANCKCASLLSDKKYKGVRYFPFNKVMFCRLGKTQVSYKQTKVLVYSMQRNLNMDKQRLYFTKIAPKAT